MKRSLGSMGLVVVFLAGCAAPPGHIKVTDASGLSPGMTRADVIRTLGKPEYGFAMNGQETITYVVNGQSWQGRTFEVKLVDGLVQTYGVEEPDPAKADFQVGSFKEQVAVPWFSEYAYARLLVLLPDAERQHAPAYDEWVERTTREEQEIRSTGRVPMRVFVEPIEVESWCRHHDVPLGKEAIAAFAGMKLGLDRNGTRTPDLALR